MTKFSLLTKYLDKLTFTSDKLTYRAIEKILESKLPPKAYTDPAWWENNPDKRQAKGWLKAGWRVDYIDLRNTVTFKKMILTENNVEDGEESGIIESGYPQISILTIRDKEAYHATYIPGDGSLTITGKIEYRWQVELLKRYLDGLHCRPAHDLGSPRFGDDCMCGSKSFEEIGEFSQLDGPLNGVGFKLNQCEECKRAFPGSMWIN